MDMTEPEADCGLTMISPTSFYSSEREKTNLNWFTYELAMSIYDEARKGLGRRLRREGVGGDALAELSVHAAKALGDQVRQRLAGGLDIVVISPELVQDRHGGLSDRTLDGMVDAMMRAWDDVLRVCETCSNSCITDHDERCWMFDEETFEREGDAPGLRPATPGGPARIDPEALLMAPPDGGPRLVHDEVLGRLMERAEGWCSSFRGSDRFRRLPPEQREVASSIVVFFARYMYIELGLLPEGWDGDAVEEGCVDALPRKVTAELDYFEMVAPVLSAFLEFAGEEGLVPDGGALAARVAPLGERIVANASDPSRWGPAKSMAMAALEAGVDLADGEAMDRFLARHSTRRDGGERRGSGRRTGTRRARRGR